jgi:hypothetical protein
MESVDVQIIAAIGKAMYGPWWQRKVARDIGVHACTVGRWLRGIGEPDIDDLHRLMSVARTRDEAILAAHEAGRRALRLPRPPPQSSAAPKP